MQISEKMSSAEQRATISLAAIYGLRMLGMFLILPIFAIYAQTLEGGQDSTMVGLALGAYGLTQVLLQLPFGIASDKYGRKKVIYVGMLIFVIGSVVAAMGNDIITVIIGRAIQGAGAVSAVVMALVADSTREEHRTKAMATIGGTIGVTFALSLVAGPLLNESIGVPGIFWMTAILSIFAIGVVKFLVPDPVNSHFHSDTETAPDKIKEVLSNSQLLRLNFGAFSLHAAQMAMFVVVPFALKETSGMSENQHWLVYLPVLTVSFIMMLPAIIYGEKYAKLKPVFIGAVATMLFAQLLFAANIHHFWGVVTALFFYFLAFNLLEATLPSLISKMAPAASKGTAIGVHNTAQSLGIFIGAVVGGFLSGHYGFSSVFVFCSVLMGIWLISAFGMKTPPSVKTKMYHVEALGEKQATTLKQSVESMLGVEEVAVLAQESTLIVKINNQQTVEAQLAIEQNILKLIGGK
ncbi:MAG: MFS transporter [Methylophilaceae bacterium]|jgi:MFS family permease|nr:MAG: MFS transporter [Methylophilaceae bacterium]